MSSLAVRLLIMDLDGTLIDSAAGIVCTFNATLEEAGFQAAPALEVSAMIGLPLEYMFRRWTPEHAWASVPSWIARYRDRYGREEVPRMRAFPGVAETLGRCRACGVPIAIATSKHTAVAIRAIEAAGLRRYIDEIVGDDQVTEKKPHPQMVLRILKDFGYPPSEALVIGDTTHDLQMGQAAGVRTCAVTYGVHDRQVLAAARPDYMIEQFPDLLRCIRH